MLKIDKNSVFMLLLIGILYGLIILLEFYNFFSYFLILLLLSGVMIHNYRHDFFSPNFLFYLFFLYTVGLGPLFLLISNIKYNYNYFTFILGGIVFYVFGSILSQFLSNNISIKKEKTLINFNIKQITVLRLLFIMSLISSIYYLYINNNYLFGDNIYSDRIAALSGNGLIFFISQFPIIIVPMLYILYKRTNRYKIDFIIITVVSTIVLLVSGFRSPVLTMYVCLLLVVFSKNNISYKKLIIIGLTFILLVQGMGIYRKKMSNFDVNNGLFQYLTIEYSTNCLNIHYIKNVFPNKINYQYGRTYLINLKMLLPGDDPDYTLWLKNKMGLEFAGGGITPTILGDLYLNYGEKLMYVGMFIYGIFGNIIYKYYKRYDKNFIGTFFVWQYAHSASGGLSSITASLLLYYVLYKMIIIVSHNDNIGAKNEK